MLRHYATYGSAAMVVMCLLVGHPVQAQTATPDACATDAAARWATVLAYESPTATNTPTPTPTPTPSPYLACHVAASANYSTTQLTVSYENFYTTTLGTHHVDAYVYIDDVLAHDAMFSLIGGASAGDFTISLQPRHLAGLHEVHYVLESQEHAPVNAECFAHFGEPLDYTEVHEGSDGRQWIYAREVTSGEDAQGKLFIVLGVLPSIAVVVYIGWRIARNK